MADETPVPPTRRRRHRRRRAAAGRRRATRSTWSSTATSTSRTGGRWSTGCSRSRSGSCSTSSGSSPFVLWIVSFFTVLFTEQNPFLGFQTMYLRYYWRVSSFVGVHAQRVPAVRLRDRHRLPWCPTPPWSTSRIPGEMNRWLAAREVAARDPALHRAVAPRHRACSSCMVDHVLRGAVHRQVARGRCATSSSAYIRWYTRVNALRPVPHRRVPAVQPAVAPELLVQAACSRRLAAAGVR